MDVLTLFAFVLFPKKVCFSGSPVPIAKFAHLHCFYTMYALIFLDKKLMKIFSKLVTKSKF